MQDKEVKNKTGIYSYVFTGEEKDLNLRTFDKHDKTIDNGQVLCVACNLEKSNKRLKAKERIYRKLKKRIIAVESGLGKTYCDKKYKEIFDTDKFTLGIKYNREKYPNLSDEEFKSTFKKEKENWFEEYSEFILKTIKNTKEPIITLWLQKDLLDFLYKNGVKVEVLIANPKYVSKDIFVKRFLRRGNNLNFCEKFDLNQTYKEYKDAKEFKVWLINSEMFLDDFLFATGSVLNGYNKPKEYVEYIKNNVKLC